MTPSVRSLGEPPTATSGRPPAVALRDVRFAYPDGTKVLDGITQDIAAGSTVGVVGPSGCGKSTLLSVIAGLLEPTGGTLQRGADGSPRHPLSMMFQRDTLLPWLTVAQNVALYARFKHQGLRPPLVRRLLRRGDALAVPQVRGRVDELLVLVRLEDYGDRYPYQLSGGQRRRLAFLVAVAPNPRILLLDEPFSALDEPTRIGIHQDVFRIARTMDTTTVLVTHDLAEALSLCDRVVILSQRPAVVAFDHAVPFGEERSMLELRQTPDFLELYGRLWHDLSTQMEHAR